MFICKCGNEFEKQKSLNSHARFCSLYEKKKSKYKIENGYKCECGKIFEKSQSLNVHFSHCLIHRNGIPSKRKHIKEGKMQGWENITKKERSEYSKKAWETFRKSGRKRPPVAEETKIKISKAVKGKTGGYREGSNKWRKCFLEKDDKKIYLDSSYELRFVKLLESFDIKWERNYRKFFYEYKEQKRNYIPDFYLPEYDLWIEVKGWEKPIDKFKWSFFPFNLEIIRKEDLEYLEAEVAELADAPS